MATLGNWLSTLKLLAALGSGLIAGTFFAFSTFVWANYLSSWTFWNHVRTIGSLAAMVAFILALRD